MFVKKCTVKTNLVAKTCALNALPICRFMESIPMTSQPMMKKQCRKQCKRSATGIRGRPNAGVWEKSNNKVPEYKADKDRCLHDTPNQYEEEEYLHFSFEKITGQPGTEKGKRTCPWSAWIVTSITFMAAENKNALPLVFLAVFGAMFCDLVHCLHGLLKTRVRYLWYF